MIRSTSFKTWLVISICLIVSSINVSKAQYLLNSDSAFRAEAPNSGKLWGLVYSDYFYKAHSDSSQRGGSNQYSGIPQSRTAFQFRRIYLGYNYNITSKFAAELELAAEDNFPAGNPPSTSTPTASGDELSNTKLAFYIKLANLRWKNIWKGTDLAIGQVNTPTYTWLSSIVWNYRSVERTVTDLRRTSSYDMGAVLQGTFDPETKNFGYDLMVGNGTAAKPESNNFRWFYGDVYGYFFNKKLVVDWYSDYERESWTSTWHHSRQMNKVFVAYNTAASKNGMIPGSGYTIGVEAYVNNLKNDNFATLITKASNGRTVDTLTTAAKGISVFVHGDIIKKKLRFFVRYDAYNPLNKVNNSIYKSYVGNTSNYNDNTFRYNANPTTVASVATGDETYTQQFFTAGLDFTPTKSVHLIPNIWYNSYASQLGGPAVTSVAANNYDLVYRLTLHYTFGE